MANTEAKKRTSRADLLTSKKANGGLWFPIPLPTGEDSGEKMLLLGSDSDAFERASIQHVRRMKEIASIENEDQKRAEREEANIKTTASLVLDWTFEDDPCTPAAVIETLKDAPYLVDAIESISLNRQRFYAGASSNLPGTPKRPTDSISPQPKDPPSP